MRTRNVQIVKKRLCRPFGILRLFTVVCSWLIVAESCYGLVQDMPKVSTGTDSWKEHFITDIFAFKLICMCTTVASFVLHAGVYLVCILRNKDSQPAYMQVQVHEKWEKYITVQFKSMSGADSFENKQFLLSPELSPCLGAFWLLS